jgi:hypothetical protein
MSKDVISLDTIDDDTLIMIFGFLTVPNILAMRQVRPIRMLLFTDAEIPVVYDRHPNGWQKYRLSISCGAMFAYLMCFLVAILSHSCP